MKNLNYLNYFFVGLPILLCVIGYIDVSFLFYGLFSTILTGFYQATIGFQMFFDEPDDRNLQVYVTAVLLFFFIWLGNVLINYNEVITYCLIATPPSLAIFFSIIIYKKANK